jgi:membrane protease YdiL (CAAX protease family)
MNRIEGFVRRALWEKVPRDQRDTRQGLRRRQAVTAVFVLLGALVLGLTLRIEPGSRIFYVATVGLAALWAAGAFASGRLHLGRIPFRDRLIRPVVTPIAIGAAMAAVFVAGALIVAGIDTLGPLERQVESVITYADQGSVALLVLITAINGIAEELFFRGAVYAAIPQHPVLWTTALYGVATAATGNIMLTFAALLLGFVCGLERRASGGILAPILTHCTWSLSMLLVLPVVFY